MLPGYRQMDSYPHQSNQVPFVQYCPPSSETIPPQMGLDPARFPAMYTPWPHGSNYGYPIPCHACCSHNGFSGGYYTPAPPCSHLLPAPPLHYNHTTFPQFYPVQYVPPPHYSMEQPRYEYDENVPTSHHCCGCPNHTHNQKEDKSVKIEEMDSDIGKKRNDSLIPVQLGNYPYPVMWVSPEFMEKKELPKQDKVPYEFKPSETTKSFEHKPNGWFPLDLKDLGSLMQGVDRKKPENEQDEDRKRKFPFPVFWMPYDRQVVGKNDHGGKSDSREMNKMTASEPVEEPSQNLKALPLKHNEGRDESRASHDNSSRKMVEKSPCQKSIPVKQVGDHGGMNSEDAKGEGFSVLVKHAEDNTVNKAAEGNGKRQSSSPSKMAKLPPVCLRVDPLPKKKNGNGSSRSRSPPGQKRHLEEAVKDASKALHSSSLKDSPKQGSQAQDNTLIKSKEKEPNRKEGRTIQAMERQPVEKQENLRTDFQSQGEVSESTILEKAEKNGNESRSDDGEAARVMSMEARASSDGEKEVNLAKPAGSECEVKKKNLTDVEAAVLIQSAYRGFEVRRWEPLKKLKRMAEVRQQLVDVQDRIQALESSDDLLKDNKQTAVVGEMIMGLLLKLDSIQGLHPSLRDIRKSLARDLVKLQERLDFLMVKKSRKLIKASSGPVCHVDTATSIGIKEMQNKEVELPLQESTCDGSHKLEESLGRSENEVKEPLLASGVESEAAEMASSMEPKEKVVMEELGCNEEVRREMEKCSDVSSDQEQCPQLPSISEEKTSSEVKIVESVIEDPSYESNQEGNPDVEEGNDTDAGDSPDANELNESQKEIISEKPSGSEIDDQTGIEEKQVLHNLETNSSGELVLPAEADNSTYTDRDADIGVLAELPLGVVEVDPSGPGYESDKHAADTSDALGGGKCQYDTVSDATSVKEEASESEQQPQEILDVAESEDLSKVGTQSCNELPRETASLVEVEQPRAKVVDTDNQKETDSLPEENPFSEKEIEVDNEGENHGVVGDTHLVAVCKEFATQEMEVSIEEYNMDQPAASCEEQERQVERGLQEAGNEKQFDGSEVVEEEALINGQLRPVEVQVGMKGVDELDGIENTKQDYPEEAESTLVAAEQGKEKGEAELLPMSPAANEVSAEERVMDISSDRRLIEENEKLRQMMAKLIETGKEQLSVISNLTGRVKDLEKKLSRKRKVRTSRGHRGATVGSTCVRQPNNASMNGCAVGMAM